MKKHLMHPASFKDPAGFVYNLNGAVYRQANKMYAEHYQQLMQSGLYAQLVLHEYLLPVQGIDKNFLLSEDWLITLLPKQIEFISYPYEWCFDQLKDAALLTLRINKIAIEYGMILKDGTPYNIQFHNGPPVFVDTLSFEVYNEKKPWVAYKQFCETFLFPLWLSHYVGSSFNRCLLQYPDGIPASLTSKLLPMRSRLSLSVWLHVELQKRLSNKKFREQTPESFSKSKMIILLTNLEKIIRSLTCKQLSNWRKYYETGLMNSKYMVLIAT